MIRSVSAIVLVSILSSFGCGGDAKKDTKAEVKKDAVVATPDAGKTAPPTPPADAPVKSEFKPDEAWTTLSTMSHMDRMTKFKDGVTITGTVTKIVDDPAGEYGLQMDGGAGNTIELRFADFGKAAKDKKIAVGATVTGTKCSPTNAEGTKMAFVTCELK